MFDRIATILATYGILTLAAAGLLFCSTTAYAQLSTYDEQVRKLLETNIKTWLRDPLIINSVKEQNVRHASMPQDEIDRLDKQWRAEVKALSRPLIDATLANSLSIFLKQVKAQNLALFSEIFIMDNKGLNVGQSDVTSDYWQGDEAKWQKTYLVGPKALLIGKREYDQSSRKFLIQVSVPVAESDSSAPIGAATIGISLVELIKTGGGIR